VQDWRGQLPEPLVSRIRRWVGAIPWWLPALMVAAGFRVVVLASRAVSFHSDEAIVGLMARHINQGQPIPTFFYGQPYMGSLDPLLVSVGFRLLGESVLAIRLVQSVLYLGLVGTTLALALRLTNDRRAAVMAGLLIALPPVALTLYTTISLGGYGETLILGNLLLLVGIDLSPEHRASTWRWLALGALAGVGWWTNSLIVVYALPVAAVLFGRWRNLSVRLVAGAAATFLIGSAPWWLYNLSHQWQSVQFLLGGFQPAGGVAPVGIGDRLIGLLVFGLPAVTGVRFPWAVNPWPGLWAVPVVILYAVMLIAAALSGRARLLWIMLAGFAAIFVLSSFGVDATGRYLLPLVVPIAILVTAQIQAFSERSRWAVGLLVILIGVNLLGNITAMCAVPPGLTPQFDPATDFTNDFDQAAIDFLLQHGGSYGYATYWAAYRLDFLSHEAVILTPQLPYKESLVYIDNDRYPAYTAAVERAERPVIVTANLPRLDQVIADRLEANGVRYQRQVIGPYTIYCALSQRVTPVALGLQALGP
jgi:4-amino-4-deoxy-L-arabinose transferase-like glycosyltransferase